MQYDGQRGRFPFGCSPCLDNVCCKIMWLKGQGHRWHFSTRALRLTQQTIRRNPRRPTFMRLCIYLVASSLFSTPVDGSSKVSLQIRGSKGGSLVGTTPSYEKNIVPPARFQASSSQNFRIPKISFVKS